MAPTHACQEVVQIKHLFFHVIYDARRIIIFYDSQRTTCLQKNPTLHNRTQHIDVKYQFLCNMVEVQKVNVEKVDT